MHPLSLVDSLEFEPAIFFSFSLIIVMASIRNLKSSSSSSFTYEYDYDVFLSFRGEDTRIGFTGNLYNALCEKGIKTFIDDQELRKGEEITPALMMAIQQSRIAIVVFSENYASSTFCLKELTKIMECIKHKGRLIWPIFYKVDPSDVRHLKGCYAKALTHCERKTPDKEKVKQWMLALKAAANLSGWHFKNGCVAYYSFLLSWETNTLSCFNTYFTINPCSYNPSSFSL